jgi:hypothetical protein
MLLVVCRRSRKQVSGVSAFWSVEEKRRENAHSGPYNSLSCGVLGVAYPDVALLRLRDVVRYERYPSKPS